MKARVAILISGTGSNMAALIYASRTPDCPYEVVLVASNTPTAPGLALAAAEGITTFGRSHHGMDRAAHDALIEAEIVRARVDTIALAGYMRLLSDEFVARWHGRMLNIHPSLLPKYKGLDTCARAIAAGDSHSGCTVHIVTPAVDDGPALGQTPVAILPGDTPDTLAQRILIAEHQLYPRILAAYVTRERDPDWILGEVRSRALALAETHERPSFGAPAWRVGGDKTGKYFAYFARNHHGDPSIALLVKTSGQDEIAALTEADPDLYYRPQFYGASGWVGIRLDTGRTDWTHIADWLAKSWRSVAPKKLTRLMDVAGEF